MTMVHPGLFLVSVVLSVPVIRAMTLAIFGTRARFMAAVRYWAEPKTWTVRAPIDEDWRAELRLFATATLAISFIASVYSLSATYLLGV